MLRWEDAVCPCYSVIMEYVVSLKSPFMRPLQRDKALGKIRSTLEKLDGVEFLDQGPVTITLSCQSNHVSKIEAAVMQYGVLDPVRTFKTY